MKPVTRIILLLLVAVLALAGVGIAVSWAPDRPVETLTARWAPPPSRFIEVDGLRVHLRDEGDAADPLPVVLLHGTSASLHTWDGWVGVLKGRHRVIRVDLPGFGLTGPRHDGNYHMTGYVRFVTALLNALDIKRCVLVGNSFGGAVAWETAVAQPQRVAALVLVDAAGYAPKAESVPIGFRIAQMPALAPLMEHLLPRRMIESSVRNVYGDPAKVTPALVDRYYELTLREGNRRALGERFRQARSGEDEALIPKVTQPTLILWGSADRLIPPEFGRRFERDIRGSRLMVFEGLGHVPHEEDPLRTVQPVAAFLDEVKGARNVAWARP